MTDDPTFAELFKGAADNCEGTAQGSSPLHGVFDDIGNGRFEQATTRMAAQGFPTRHLKGADGGSVMLFVFIDGSVAAWDLVDDAFHAFADEAKTEAWLDDTDDEEPCAVCEEEGVAACPDHTDGGWMADNEIT